MTDEYKAIFATFELDEQTLQLDKGETIIPTIVSASESLRALDALPRFTMNTQAVKQDADYHIIDTLGEGGMGVVSLAEQTALRRLVAVKESKGNNQEAHSRVLDEAFILGRVEHPNVVPAYGLGRRESGQPILVMKRVEGTSWDDVLFEKAGPPDGGVADLAWHLRVMLQVCNALRFAHARQVVHRDIKPENVMIGEFGEVYLLDWGIAVSLDPNADDGLPTAHSTNSLAGTPAFMAPEMSTQDGVIDERTDVYLLGSNLHLILTGKAPHAGDSLMAICMAAYNSEPKIYGDDVPSELADIARKAMAREKGDRWQSVAAFAAAISDYLEHRASYQLSDAASEVLLSVRENAQGVETTNRLLEAEFGFRQSLTIWADNEAAKRGLQSAIEAKIESCLEREELGGAQAALGQLLHPNPELAGRVEALSQELDDRAERVDYLERFERDLDLKTGTRSRQRTVLVLGFSFAALCFASAWVQYNNQSAYSIDDWLNSYWRLLAIAVLATIFFRRKLMANVANRRLMTFFLSALVVVFLLRFSASALKPPQLFLLVAEQCTIGMAAAAIGASTGRRLTLVALVYAASVMLTVLSNQIWSGYIIFGVAHLIFFGYTAWLWRPSLTSA